MIPCRHWASALPRNRTEEYVSLISKQNAREVLRSRDSCRAIFGTTKRLGGGEYCSKKPLLGLDRTLRMRTLAIQGLWVPMR